MAFTIETRPDQISLNKLSVVSATVLGFKESSTQITVFLKLTGSAAIEDAIDAIHLLKDGVKGSNSRMPNLPGSTPDLDVAMFSAIYSHTLQSDDENLPNNCYKDS